MDSILPNILVALKYRQYVRTNLTLSGSYYLVRSTPFKFFSEVILASQKLSTTQLIKVKLKG